MARVPDIRRLDKSDFDKENQDLVDKLAFPLNSFMEQTRAAFQKNIDFVNLNQEVILLSVIVDEIGTPVQKTQYKSTLNTKVLGNVCIASVNTTTAGAFPNGQPFLTFAQDANIVTVTNIKGLVAGQRYTLTVLSIGA